MSKSQKLGGAIAVASAVPLVWLIVGGHAPEIVSYMDDHNGFFAGIGALITAFATAVIAFYTKSTRDLFKLERGKAESAEVRVKSRLRYLAGTLARTVQNVDDLIEMLEDTSEDIESAERLDESLADALKSQYQRLRGLLCKILKDISEQVRGDTEELSDLAPLTSPQITKLITDLETGGQGLAGLVDTTRDSEGGRFLEDARTCRSQVARLHRKIASKLELGGPEVWRAVWDDDPPDGLFPE